MRGTGFGLRLALAIAGFVVGPFIAINLMKVTGDDFRLVFWVALLPAYLSVVVLVIAVKEVPRNSDDARAAVICRSDLAALPSQFWWAILIAGLLSLARFSPAFLILKAHDIGVDAAFVPLIFVVIYLVYSLIAYPCGVLADHVPPRLQLAIGVAILICADVVLASASTLWVTALGAAFWGLHLGMTQGLLGATVADAASDRLRGTAFGMYDVAIGVATFAASAGAGVLWTAAGSAAAFAVGACIAAIAGLLVLLRPLPASAPGSS
jgi:MFS family permease